MEKSSYANLAPTSIANSAPLSIFSYCASSILMTVTNKYVLSGDFNLNFFLLAVQSAVCIVTISSLKAFGVITYRQFDREEAKKWSPIALLLVAMIYTGSKAIKYLPVPVYTIFKNLTIIIIAYGEVLWFGGKVTSMALGSFSLMVMSSVVSYFGESADNSKSSADIYVLYLGYAWMAVNCFASAAFVLFMRKRIKLTNFKDFDTMYYNNLLSIPVLLVLSIVFENWSPENIEVNFPTDNRTATIVAIVFSGLSSVGISYCSAWCVRVTSSTTYSMVGALNKLPIALSGLIFFESAINFFSISSIFLGFAAGLVYSVAKQRQAKEASMQLPTSSK